jgi:hypothetical protein
MSWVDEVLEATDEAESPKSFIYWSALCAISAVVKNNIWIQKRGLFRLYPTIYVLLIANSGLRKSFPVSVARHIVNKVNCTRVLGGRISVQALISSLSKAYTVEGETRPRTDAAGFIASGEFSTAFVKDPDAFTIMTDLYDNHYNPTWVNTLKSSGTEELKNISITMLGAINQSHFNNLLTETDISGGFIARCILVVERKRSRKNSLLAIDGSDGIAIDYDKLSIYLRKLRTLAGPFILTPKAITAFNDWYYQFEPEEIDDKTGTANRIHDQILKVAMLLALADKPELVIREEVMREAMNVCLSLGTNITKITAGGGKSKLAPQNALVLQYLLEIPGGREKRSNLLRRFYGSLDASDLDAVISTLTQAGGIKEVLINKELTYELNPDWLAQYSNYKMAGD